MHREYLPLAVSPYGNAVFGTTASAAVVAAQKTAVRSAANAAVGRASGVREKQTTI